MTSNQPETVIIVGGSLSALMHGTMLARQGSCVTILEQSPDSALQSHMAGVCLGPDVLWFLARYDLLASEPLGIPSATLRTLDKHGNARVFVRAPRVMSSWESLYFRLRANFDGLASSHYPSPPTADDRLRAPAAAIEGAAPADEASAKGSLPWRHGSAAYEVGKRVTGLVDEGQRVRVTYTEHATGRTESAAADLVLGADGPNSVVRRLCGGAAAATRAYAGYVAWRGVVSEAAVSAEMRETFAAHITYNMLGAKGHVIVYNIPGKDGSVEPGSRFLNFCWYTNVPDGEGLADIMTDVDGVVHHTSIAPGKVRPEVWAQQREIARTVFHARYLAIIDHIASPFVHKITDYYSPDVTYMDRKVLLVGDSATLLRPHIAFSTNQAAYQCKLLERVVSGEMNLERWEWLVTRFTWVQWLRSIWYGEFFQRPWTSIFAAVPFWAATGLEKVRYFMGTVPQISR